MVSLAGLAGSASTVNIVINGVDNFSSTFSKAGSMLGNIGKIAGTAVVGSVALAGTALAGLGITSVNTAREFETAFIGVRKTTDLTGQQFADLRDRFKDLSEEIPITFKELSSIGEIAGQLGVEGVDNIEKFSRTIADISNTTVLTAESAATDFARIANIMEEPIENVDRMGASIVDLGNNFAANEAEISNFAQRIAGAGKIAGLTTADIFAIGTAFSAVGVQAEMGGTSVQKVLNAMTQSVATGDEKLEVFANTAGMTVQEFSEMFKEDASQAFASFVTGLGTQGDDAFKTLEDLSLQNERVIRSFLSLAESGDLINQTFSTAGTAFEQNSALSEEAAKRYESFDSQVQILKNTFENLIEPLGAQLLPILLDVANIFSEKVFPAIEPLIPIIGDAFVNAIKNFTPLIEPLTEIFTRFTKILVEDLFPAISPLIEVFTNFGLNLASVAVSVLQQLLPAFNQLIPVVVNVLEIMGEALLNAIMELTPALVELVPQIADLLVALTPLLPPLTELLILVLRFAVITVNNMIPAIAGFIDGLTNIVGPIKTAIKFVSDLVSWFTKLWDSFTQLAGGGLGDLLSKVGAGLGSVFELGISTPLNAFDEGVAELNNGTGFGGERKQVFQTVNYFNERTDETADDIQQNLKRVE